MFTGGGMSEPVVSTGMSSYASKLMTLELSALRLSWFRLVERSNELCSCSWLMWVLLVV